MNVSVIIPVYNVERFVERCVRSVMNQTYTEGVECIIVNDCTQDKSMEIVERMVEEYNGPIGFRLLYHEQNRGIAVVRNTGLEVAKGEYIIHIDSDDYCEPDMLEKMYGKAIEENADIVVADYWETFPEKEIYRPQILPHGHLDKIKHLLDGRLYGANWNKLVRRTLFMDNGIRYAEGINMREDSLVTLRLFYYAKNITHIADAFLHYVKYNPNSYVTAVSRKTLQDLVLGEDIILDFFSKIGLAIQLKDELFIVRLKDWNILLFRSKGKLQKEWNKRYRDITPYMIIKHHSFVQGIYMKLALCFASLRMLWAYNFMRRIWRIIKKSQSKEILLYSE